MTSPILIGVAGAAGRMGRMVMAEVMGRQDVQLVRAYEKNNHPLMGMDAGVLCGDTPCDVVLTDDIEDFFKHAQVVIDFSAGEMAALHSECAADTGAALVIGSTGMDDDAMKRIEASSARIAIVCAPNMSRGVQLLRDLAQRAAKVLGEDYDAEIVEYHHRHKKDAPSGTALMLGKSVAHGRGESQPRHFVNRQGERPVGGVGYGVVRGGEMVGEHHLLFIGKNDVIEITHKAFHRAIYAQGSVDAAVWAASQNAGIYNMSDVINYDSQ